MNRHVVRHLRRREGVGADVRKVKVENLHTKRDVSLIAHTGIKIHSP